MANKKYHNKKRNVALLYEMLSRHTTKCIIEGDKQEAAKTLNIFKKYFSEGTLLHEELSLYQDIAKTTVQSREYAMRMFDEICKKAASLDLRKVDAQKSKLIKEINYDLKASDQVYNYRIPNYTVYASLNMLLSDSTRKNKILPTGEKVKLEENITSYLLQEKMNAQEALKINPNYNNAVYKFIIERFNKKYANKLSDPQKKILSKYVVSLLNEDKSSIKSAVQKECKIILEKLSFVNDSDIKKDSDLMSKIKESRAAFVKIDFSNITEENVMKLLQYMNLISEIGA